MNRIERTPAVRSTMNRGTKDQEILHSKMRQVTSAIKDGREANSTSMYDPTTDALLAIRTN
jgi:hypothetical protein